jgi:hypothetical protein
MTAVDGSRRRGAVIGAGRISTSLPLLLLIVAGLTGLASGVAVGVAIIARGRRSSRATRAQYASWSDVYRYASQ